MAQTTSVVDPLLTDSQPVEELGPDGEAEPGPPPTKVDEKPPYPFESGNSLLALTKTHNVSSRLKSMYIMLISMTERR